MSQPGARRFESQFKSVVAAFHDHDPSITLEPAWHHPDGERLGLVPDFVIERGAALCRSNHVGFVMDNADPELEPLGESRNSRPGAGVQVLRVREPLRPDMRTPHLVARLNDMWRRQGNNGDVAIPHHIVSICGNGVLCPADEPVPAPRWPLGGPRPPQRQDNAGQGVRVWVLDTGLIGTPVANTGLVDPESLRAVYPWLTEVPHGQERVPRGQGIGIGGSSRTTAGPPEHPIAEYRGHGTFIAGVLKCVAPGADVTVMNILQKAGAELELDLANALMSLHEREGGLPDIISLSAGSMIRGDRRGLLGLEEFLRAVQSSNSNTVLVAAAGNNGGTDPFWPAAYASDGTDWVLSVGALREDGKGRACFSNYGDWVQVYAPGERLVNAFDKGEYRYVDAREPRCIYYGVTPLYQPCTCTDRPDRCDERTFDGLAEWSGTSFATPIVAGRVAAYMTEHEITNARDAAQEIRMEAHRNAIRDAADHRLLPVVEPRPPMDSGAILMS
jgi:hypothetical protein